MNAPTSSSTATTVSSEQLEIYLLLGLVVPLVGGLAVLLEQPSGLLGGGYLPYSVGNVARVVE